jgi:hypothetical protein
MTHEEKCEFLEIDPAAEGYLFRLCLEKRVEERLSREKRFEENLRDQGRLSAQIAETRAAKPDHPSLERADALLADLNQKIAAYMSDFLNDFRPEGRPN